MMVCAKREVLCLGPKKITRRELKTQEKIVLMMDLHMIEITWKNKIKLYMESKCDVGAKIGSSVGRKNPLIPLDMHVDLNIGLHKLIHRE